MRKKRFLRPSLVLLALSIGCADRQKRDIQWLQEKAEVVFEENNPGDLRHVSKVVFRSIVTDADMKRLASLNLVRLTILGLAGTGLTGSGLKELSSFASLRDLDLSHNHLADDELEPLSAFKNLRVLKLSYTGISDRALGVLSLLTNLEELGLEKTQVTEEGFKRLRSLVNLRTLSFYWNPITSAGVRNLATFRKLERLHISEWLVNDSVLRTLKEVDLLHVWNDAWAEKYQRPRSVKEITAISLFGALVTNVGLEELSSLENLRSLSLRVQKAGITDQGLKMLATFPRLRHLEAPSGITDEGLKYIAQLKELESLIISHTRVTDAGLKHLLGLRNLKQLDLASTKVTREGQERLRKAIPSLAIRQE
jgi:internalin A